MPTINFTNTFNPNTRAKASEVNTNFQDINDWLLAGSIELAYLAPFDGELGWLIDGAASKAIHIDQQTNEESILLEQKALLGSTFSTFSIVDLVAQTTGKANFSIVASNPAHAVPLISLQTQGSGPILRTLTAASVIGLELTNSATEIKYNAAGGLDQVFAISGAAQLRIKTNTLELQDSTTIRFGTSNGPILSRVDSTAIGHSGNKIKFLSGPAITAIDSSTLQLGAESGTGAIRVVAPAGYVGIVPREGGVAFEGPGLTTGRFYPDSTGRAALVAQTDKALAVRDITNNVERPIVVSEPESGLGLRIVRGNINADGSVGVATPAGFIQTGIKTAIGKYQIFFNPPFTGGVTSTGIPTVTATLSARGFIHIDGVTSEQVVFHVFHVDGYFIDRTFSFIAIGRW